MEKGLSGLLVEGVVPDCRDIQAKKRQSFKVLRNVGVVLSISGKEIFVIIKAKSKD